MFKKDLGRGLEILSDILMNSLIDEGAVERERDVIIREMEEVNKQQEEVRAADPFMMRVNTAVLPGGVGMLYSRERGTREIRSGRVCHIAKKVKHPKQQQQQQQWRRQPAQEQLVCVIFSDGPGRAGREGDYHRVWLKMRARAQPIDSFMTVYSNQLQAARDLFWRAARWLLDATAAAKGP